MARAKDHVLLDAIRGRGLHDVFRQTRTDTNPSCECEQRLGAELRAETPDDVGSVVAGEAQREWVVEHPGWRLFSMQGSRDRGQHGGAARPAGGELHAIEMLGSLMSRPLLTANDPLTANCARMAASMTRDTTICAHMANSGRWIDGPSA